MVRDVQDSRIMAGLLEASDGSNSDLWDTNCKVNVTDCVQCYFKKEKTDRVQTRLKETSLVLKAFGLKASDKLVLTWGQDF